MRRKISITIAIIVALSIILASVRVLTKKQREKRKTEIFSSLLNNAIGEDAAHYYEIAKAHPDYKEIANGTELIEYINYLPKEQSLTAKQILGTGTADEVIKLLSDYKEFREDIKKIMEY